MSKMESPVTSMKTRSKGTVVVNMDPDSLIVRRPSVGSNKVTDDSSSTGSSDKTTKDIEAKEVKVRTRSSSTVQPVPAKEVKATSTQQSAKSTPSMANSPKLHKPPVKSEVHRQAAMSVKRPASCMSQDHSVNLGFSSPPRKRKVLERESNGEKMENDFYCWLCHKEGTLICCELCVRSYHMKCLGRQVLPGPDWVCPECEKIMQAECIDTRSKAMGMLRLEQLMALLKFALQRMNHHTSGPFQNPVDTNLVQNYSDYIINPMDLKTLESNLNKKIYGCTEAFLADAKWILHNCIIFNGTHHKLTSAAKMIVKICRHEMNEIEICPDCYMNASTKSSDNWFCEPCRTPHTLVWAKLKGYPFWPAKVLREVDGQVDVRFFGAHDRAWVPVSQVYLLSKEPPTQVKNRKGGFDYSVDEVEQHIEKIREKFGQYDYASFRVPYDKNNVYNHNKFRPHTVDGVPVKKLKLFSKEQMAASMMKSKMSMYKKSAKLKMRSLSSSIADNTKPTEKQSVVTKAASALKNKYSSIITTRRAAAKSQNSDNSADSGSSHSSVPQGVFSFSSGDKFPSENKPLELSVNTDKPIVKKPQNLEILKRLQIAIDKRDEESSVKTDSDCETSEGDRKTADKVDGVNVECESDIKRTSDSTQDQRVEDSSGSAQRLPEGHESKRNEAQGSHTDSSENDTRKSNDENKEPLQNEPADSTLKLDSEEAVKDSPITTSSVEDKTSSSSTSQCDTAAQDTVQTVSTKVTETESPKKKNPFLENLVASCKAKLGISESEVDLGSQTPVSVGDSSTYTSSSEAEEDSSSSSEDEEEEEEDEEKDEVTTNGDDSEKTKLTTGTKEPEKEQKEPEEEPSSTITEKNNGAPSSEQNVPSSEQNEGRKGQPTSDLKKSDSDSTPSDKTDQSKSADQLLPDPLRETSPAQDRRSSTDDLPPPILELEVLSKKSDNHSDAMTTDESMDENRLVIDERVDVQTVTESPSQQGQQTSKDATNSSKITEDSISDKERAWNELRIQRQREKFNEFINKANEKHTAPKRKPVAFPKISINSPPKTTTISTMNSNPLNSHQSSSASGTASQNVSKALPPSSSLNVTNQQPPPPPALKFQGGATVGQMTVNKPVVVPQKSLPFILPKETVPSTSSANKIQRSQDERCKSAEPANFSKYSNRVLEVLKGTFEDMYNDLVSGDAFQTLQRKYNEEIEKLQWQHKQQLTETKHNAELTLTEMRASLESEKLTALAEMKKQMEAEKQTAILTTKKKQWCANCYKEAIFYCCWNTSYCDYPCQQAHWPTHMVHCSQSQNATHQPAQDGSMQASASKTNTLSAEHLTNQVQRAVNIQQSPSVSANNNPSLPPEVASHTTEWQESKMVFHKRQIEKQPKISCYTTVPGPVQFIQPTQNPPQRQLLPAQSPVQVQYVPVSGMTNISTYPNQTSPQIQRLQMQGSTVMNPHSPVIQLGSQNVYHPINIQQSTNIQSTQILPQRPLQATPGVQSTQILQQRPLVFAQQPRLSHNVSAIRPSSLPYQH